MTDSMPGMKSNTMTMGQYVLEVIKERGSQYLDLNPQPALATQVVTETKPWEPLRYMHVWAVSDDNWQYIQYGES